MSKDEGLAEIDLIFHFETPDAYCVSVEEDHFGHEVERIWLPKSQVEYHKESDTFTMPQWLAEKKDLV